MDNHLWLKEEKMCNVSCKKCNISTGLCESGCQAGWTGDNCQTECDPGRYGEDCISHCGHCLDGRSCNRANGSCLLGCLVGYQTPLCILAHSEDQQTSSLPFVIAGVDVILILLVMIVVVLIVRKKRATRLEAVKKRSLILENPIELSFTSQNTFDVIPRTSFCNSTVKQDTEKRNSFKTVSYMNRSIETNKLYLMEEETEYMNETTTQYILIDKLEEIIARKRANGNKRFKSEYAALPTGEIHRCEEGKKPENISKNRFITIFPYDHSRVVLQVTEDEPSDYINANYIDGLNRTKEYIATEGPSQNTIIDFWRMVWQEGVSLIVMLTNLTEGKHVKCTKYWPKRTETLAFGHVSVCLDEEKIYAFFIKRTISVCNTLFQERRNVSHYQYTDWPDHKTPNPMSLIDFHQHVINSENKKNGPMVIHCSAGVGRTGTYIALDALYQEGRKTGKVNVVEFVKKMRENRVSMVQTYEQYITIYLALCELFKAPFKMKSVTEFCTKLEKITSKHLAVSKNYLYKEYQTLVNIRQSNSKVGHKATRKTLTGGHSNQVFRSSSYFTPIYIPSVCNPSRFIVTPCPTPEGAVDFLSMLIDHGSDTVVCLHPLHDVESIKRWLPVTSSCRVTVPFNLHSESNSRKLSNRHKIDVLPQQKEEPHSLEVFGPRSRINPFGEPHNRLELLSLVSDVINYKTDKPITVVNSDGISLCGVFIAVHNVIQQLNMDGAVDVMTVVRQIQVRQPELCNSIDEYEMIYRAVYDHLQTT